MIRPLSAVLISTILCFAVGEWFSGKILEAYGNALENTRTILEARADIGWRQRPDLDTLFLGIPLETNEVGWRTQPLSSLPEGKTVLILGPSSTFGWGVRVEETYAAELQSRLEGRATVINAGEIGYSSDQGVRLFSSSYVQSIEPRAVIIAYGVNDLDRHRFYFQSEKTDREEFAEVKSEQSVRFLNLVRSSALAHLFLKAANILPRNEAQESLRVPLDHFKENTLSLVESARQKGAAVILLTTATNLPDSLPDGSAERKEVERLITDIPIYNDALRDIAKEQDVPLGDIDAWFLGHDRSALFVDPIHFSPLGNQIIAEHLQELLERSTVL